MPRIGANIADLPLPVATLDEAALAHNLATMAHYCAENGVLLAPHGKTTMSPEIIRRQLAHGAWAITAATAWQAAVIASFGVDRIILANQVVDAGSLALLDRLLEDRPGLELYCLADSPASLRLLTAGVRDPGRLRVLVELGLPGGRTGLRDDSEALTLAREVDAGPAVLGGIAAFEGIVAAPTLAANLALVDGLSERLRHLADRLEAPIVTVGGSAFFDRVVAVLAGGPFRLVLRSGCYVTHDAGAYEELSPFGASAREPLRLREALHVWAPVLSVPEPGLALAGLGRRDVSADAGLPIPQGPYTAIAVNDQHTYLSFAAGDAPRVGDVIRFGISHPCTTFDKWRVIPLVSGDGTVRDLVHTQF